METPRLSFSIVCGLRRSSQVCLLPCVQRILYILLSGSVVLPSSFCRFFLLVFGLLWFFFFSFFMAYRCCSLGCFVVINPVFIPFSPSRSSTFHVSYTNATIEQVFLSSGDGKTLFMFFRNVLVHSAAKAVCSAPLLSFPDLLLCLLFRSISSSLSLLLICERTCESSPCLTFRPGVIKFSTSPEPFAWLPSFFIFFYTEVTQTAYRGSLQPASSARSQLSHGFQSLEISLGQ